MRSGSRSEGRSVMFNVDESLAIPLAWFLVSLPPATSGPVGSCCCRCGAVPVIWRGSVEVSPSVRNLGGLMDIEEGESTPEEFAETGGFFVPTVPLLGQ